MSNVESLRDKLKKITERKPPFSTGPAIEDVSFDDLCDLLSAIVERLDFSGDHLVVCPVCECRFKIQLAKVRVELAPNS